MSRWKEQFEGHPLHQTLKELDAALRPAPEGIDQQHLLELGRLQKVVRFLQERLQATDPELASPELLDQMEAILRHPNVWDRVEQYQANRDHASLVTINDQITRQLLQLATQLPTAGPTPTPGLVGDLEESVRAFVKGLSDRQKELDASLKKLQKVIERQEHRAQELARTVDERRTQVDSLLSTWQEQFARDQATRSKTYSEWLDDKGLRTQELEESLRADAMGRIQSLEQEYTEKLEERLEDATKKHKAIVDLYELTAGDSVAAAYIADAEQERRRADRWRWITIGFTLATSAWLGFAWYYYANGASQTIGWVQGLTGLSLTGVLLFGAAYAAQQSARHRANERQTRWFALEVKAIDPFIHSLGEDDQRELKKALSERLFGRALDRDPQGPRLGEHHAFKLLTKAVVDILGGLSKIRH